MDRIGRMFIGIVLVAAIAGACSTGAPTPVPPPSDPVVTEAQATEMATNALRAYNEGDYAGWTRDWSPTMKSVVPEKDWKAGLPSSYETLGRFVAIEKAELISYQPGTYGYTFTVQFEKRAATFRLSFQGAGRLVEGVHVG